MREPERLNAVTGEYAAACRSVAESYSAVSGRKREREEGNVGERGEDGKGIGAGDGATNDGSCSNGSGGGRVAVLDVWTTMQEQPKWQTMLR